ncbi:MAG: chemotaxis protein CheA [Spirochaetales bacterium]|nr:chemotaxis protein CheA [Spirochaetales bacterium]
MDNPLSEIFIEEAEENIELLESRIIFLENDPEDQETINEAFRAIHSLKGGAGLAGFTKMKDFCHKAEDLFEKIRCGELKIQKNIITVLLQILDVLQVMIGNIKNNIDADDEANVDNVIEKINQISTSESSEQIEEEVQTKQENIYFLELNYYPEIFKSGIDPLMFIQDLKKAGKIIEIELKTNNLPSLEEYDPHKFYLSWKLFYSSELDSKGIADVFCFVIDESEIKINCISDLPSDNPDLKKFIVNEKTAASVLSDNIDPSPVISTEKTKVQLNRRASDLNSGSYIRVQTDKLEQIFNTVSEVIVSQARMSMLCEEYEEILPDNFMLVSESLKSIIMVLQEQVTSLRMVNLSGTFNRFKRVVRDMASDLNKTINLEISGQETELDKNMIEKLNDPLKHIVRNCIDHGIETEEERIKLGKPAAGCLKMAAYVESGKVVIEIADDGRGIDKEKIIKKAIEKELIPENYQMSETEVLNLIFHPGLSTAASITDISGRGVGMDVVKNAISDINGTIDIISEEGKGSSFRLYLPLTLAILDGMLVSIGTEKYIIPTLAILEIFSPELWQLKTISGKGEVVFFRGSYIPIIRLHEILDVKNVIDEPRLGELIVVVSNGVKAALLVDSVMDQYQIVLKSLQKNFRKVENISSATILGDGNIALILDINGIMQKRV